MPRNPKPPFELKLGYLIPVFFVLGVLINLGITSSPRLALQGFAAVIVRPASFADYSRDPADLIFPAIDPEIIGEIINDSINYQVDLAGSPTPGPPNSTLPSGATSTLPVNPTANSTATLQASPTPIDGILTLVPTLTPLFTLVPTLAPTLDLSLLTLVPTLTPLFTLVPTLPPTLDLSILTPTSEVCLLDICP